MQISNLYCYLYWDYVTDQVGVYYTMNEDEICPNCVVVSDAGCVQEAERMAKEEYVWIREEGRRIWREQAQSALTSIASSVVAGATRERSVGITYIDKESLSDAELAELLKTRTQ